MSEILRKNDENERKVDYEHSICIILALKVELSKRQKPTRPRKRGPHARWTELMMS